MSVARPGGDADAVVVEIDGLVKAYAALRPLRIASLTVRSGERMALIGPDQAAAEMLVTVVTGASLPDEGVVRLFGEVTSDIPTGEHWLALLDRVGILSDRAVLVEQYSVAQNIAMPLTLTLEPIAPAMMPRVLALLHEVGLDEAVIDTPVGAATPAVRARVRLARAVALDPALVLAEHPTASLPPDEVAAFAKDLSRVARRRALAVVAASLDRTFVRAFDGTPLLVDPVSGQVRKQSLWEKISF